MTLQRRCPHCSYPIVRRSNGMNHHRCGRCGRLILSTELRKSAATSNGKNESMRASSIRSALSALELTPERVLRERGRSVRGYLTPGEYDALSYAFRFVVAELRKRSRYPKALVCDGVQLWLGYPGFGKVSIVSRRTGRTLVSDWHGAI